MAINLQGWDFAYALPFSEMNKGIQQKFGNKYTMMSMVMDADGNPRDPSSTCTDAASPCRKINGNIGRPKLIPGGGGENLHLLIEMPEGASFSYDPAAPGNRPKEIPVSKVTITLQVRLGWVAAGLPAQHQLQVDTNSPVEILTMDYHETEGAPPESRLTGGEKLIFQEAVKDYFQQNPDYFTETFAVALLIQPGEGADSDKEDTSQEFAWVKPTALGYAVIDDTNTYDESKSIFGVLGMTEGTDKPLLAQLPGQCIPVASANDPNRASYAEVNASFMISSQQVLKHLILSNVALLFKGASADDFEISGNSLYNNKDLTLQETKLSNGETVEPKVETSNFSISLEDTLLRHEIKLSFFNSPGVEVKISDTSYSKFFLYEKEGKQQIGASYEFGNTNTEVEVKTWVEIVVLASDIVAAILAGLVTSLAEIGMEAYATKAAEGGNARANLNTRAPMGDTALPSGTEMTTIPPEAELERLAAARGWKRSGTTWEGPEVSDSDSDSPAHEFIIDDAAMMRVLQRDAHLTHSQNNVGNGAGALGTPHRPSGVGQLLGQHRAKIAAVFAFLITLGIGEGVLAYMKASLEDETMPDLEELVKNISDHIDWPGAKDYEIKTIGLNEALQIGLKINFAE